MLDKIFAFSEQYSMFPKGAAVICGLSGGADSVCLTVCLKMLSEKLDISVEAVHVNHCIRGSESIRDEQFCRDLCGRLGIALTVFNCDVPEYSRKHGLSLEEAARIMRYQAFADCSENKLIATAHNANDNLETALLNLVRGTGIKGISGIPPIRGNIVRPLLTVTRSEIEEFLKKHELDYVTDSTNFSDDYTRNKLRHKVIPLLEELNSSVVSTSISSLNVLRDENLFIENELEKAFIKCKNGSELHEITNLHPLIRKRCIAALLSENKIPYSYERLTKCDDIAVNGGKLCVGENLYIISDGKKLELKKIHKLPSAQEISAELIIGENSIFDGSVLTAELIPVKNINIHEIVNRKLAIYYLDYDKIIGRAVLRNRRFGDKIKLSGKNFTSSVKKLINERVPKEKRSSMHFIEDDLGTVFAEYIGVADRAAPDEKTVNALKITIKHKI